MSLRALFALLLYCLALIGGAGAFEQEHSADEAACDCCGPESGHCGTSDCALPARAPSAAAQSAALATAQALQLKARRAHARATAAAHSLFYAPFLTATKPDANEQALARATADPALATPTPALRVTQCRWLL